VFTKPPTEPYFEPDESRPNPPMHKSECRKVNVNKYIKQVRKVKYAWGPLMVAQWLRHCATNRKVAGSIPDGDTGIFH
jgi:hypothetical protein